MPAVPDRAGGVSDVGITRSEPFAPRGNPFLVHVSVEFLEIRIDYDDAFSLLRFQHDLLVTQPECGRDDRHPIFETCSSELSVERNVVASDEQRHHDIGFCCLQPLDHRIEIHYVERNELLAHELSRCLLEIDLHPICRDVPIVVVSSKRVNLPAMLLRRPWYKHAKLLGRCHPSAEH